MPTEARLYMDNSAIKWFESAQQDLDWTEVNLKENIFHGTCFTAQQSAEEALEQATIIIDFIRTKLKH